MAGRPQNLTPAVALRGNTRNLQTGAYARLLLGDRAEQLADALRETAPIATPADDAAFALCGMLLAQLERANVALLRAQGLEAETRARGGAPGKADREQHYRLSADARGWSNSVRRLLNDLGMTPMSRAALGFDLARTEDIVTQLRERYTA